MTPRRTNLNRLLVTLVLAAAGSAFAAPPPGAAGGHGGHGGHGMMMPEGAGLGRMLGQVNATPEQRAQIEQIMKDARADLDAQREAGRSLRQQAMQVFTQPTVDAAAAEALRQQMLAQHDKASQRSMQAMLEVSRVLTAEQRQQLAEQMKKRAETMRPHRGERQPRG